MTWRGCCVGLLVGSAVTLLGCDAVPAIRFVDESGADDGSDAIDEEMDTSPGSGCLTALATGGAVCCGSVWCVGECDASCPRCATMCDGNTSFCCDRAGQTPQCKQPAAACK